MKSKIACFAYCLVVPFLVCLGIFVGDAITAKITPKAKAAPTPPCFTKSATVTAYNDSQFPARQRYIGFHVTGTCHDTDGYGCSWTAYQKIYKLVAIGVYQLAYQGNSGHGNECGASSWIDWTDDFATWGEGVYKVEIEVYDDLPILAPTLLKYSLYTFSIDY